MGNKQRTSVPHELEGAATVKDVSLLEGKVDNCYSKDRYEEFQGAVEKIADRWLKGKVGWAVFIWLITLIGSILAEKFFRIF